jgi:deoxyribodipyrimidine photo-lyase
MLRRLSPAQRFILSRSHNITRYRTKMSSTVQDLDQGSRQSSGQDRINVLVYLLRRDLRLSDNPIFHTLSQEGHPFTHLLPIYVFPAQQIEVSGFIDDGTKSPYPEARGQVGNFWRCGPHRAKFLSESVWNLKKRLENMGSGLVIRLGMVGEVARKMLDTDGKMKVGAVWMTGEEGVEEGHEEQDVKKACEDLGVDFKLWVDEKYLVDEYVPTLHTLEIL